MIHVSNVCRADPVSGRYPRVGPRNPSTGGASARAISMIAPPDAPHGQVTPYIHNVAILAAFDAVPQDGQVPGPTPAHLAI